MPESLTGCCVWVPERLRRVKWLRALLGDPILVRAGRGMAPTARAQGLAGPLREGLALLERVQRAGDATNAELGEAVHLSPSQISRRLARLADVGIIAGQAALTSSRKRTR